MKKIVTTIIVLAQVLSVAFNAYAVEKLPAPSWVRWSSSTKGMATWAPVDGSEGEYAVELYRDGNKVFSSNNLNLREESWRYGHGIDQDGTYTFRVKAYGDNENFYDSEWSDFSEPYVYKKPKLEYGPVRHVRWLQNGVVTWDPPLSIPSGYANDLVYEVRLYTNGVGDYARLYVNQTSQSMLDFMRVDGAVYYASVRALSKDIEHIANGPAVFTDEYLDTGEIGRKVLVKLKDLLYDLRTGVASPSDAEKKIEEMGSDNLAVAIQANSGAEQQLEKLDNWYMENTGTNVSIITGEGTGLDSVDIRVIGAGLNVASPGNAVRVNISKPEKSVAIDAKEYKSLAQFDISIDGANGKDLRSPIVVTMPVPKGIKGSRLWILHHHQDGSYEIIYPTLIDNDTKVRFTVTSLSVFSFVTDPDEINDNSGNTSDDNSSSGNSFSGGSISSSTADLKTWMKDENGWWLKNPDGTWPKNEWVQAYWNGKKDWYFFDESGYMVTGWVTWEGNRYYLHPVSDGMQGYMYTGWHEIDGKWYYFRTENGGPEGSLFVNGTTPDGYLVDEKGVWIS